MVASSRISSQKCTPNGVETHFTDGGFELRPYKYDSEMDNGETTGNYVDLFPVENQIHDLIFIKRHVK